MSRDFETVDLTSSFYQINYNDYLMSDTIIEINDSYTSNGGGVRRTGANITRNRRRRRHTSTSLNDNNPVGNGTVIEINNASTVSPGKKKSPRKRRSDGGPANSSTPLKIIETPQEPPVVSPKKARKSALECPICWDDMLNKPLVTTKCGHVFCKNCLKKSLKTMKSCPKCRQSLAGSKAYHPLYVEFARYHLFRRVRQYLI